MQNKVSTYENFEKIVKKWKCIQKFKEEPEKIKNILKF